MSCIIMYQRYVHSIECPPSVWRTYTKGIQKVRSFWGKMTSQTKKFVVMIKLTIIEVSTKNIMFNLFLVSFLEFFKHQYPT